MATGARADVKMPLIFGDHMVLQQQAKLPIWGWADPSEKVSVTFAGQTGSTVAAADGTWRVDLAPVTVDAQGKTLTMTGKNTITLQDVLVGDVWIASGQSNMEYGIHKTQFADDVAKADDPLLRLFCVPKTTALEPQKDIQTLPKSGDAAYGAKWLLCTPENLSKMNGQGFAAAAYFFARDLRALKKQPLGLIESSWGGTRAEAWTSLESLKKDPILDHYVKMQAKNVANEPEMASTYEARLAAHDAALKEWNETTGKVFDQAHRDWTASVAKAQASGQPVPPEPKASTPRPTDVQAPTGGSNGPSNLFNAMISPLIPMAIKGVIWYQGEFNSGYDSGREYATLFPRMITDWREHWGQGDFPFIFVQLPNLGRPATTPSETPGSWVWVRESQFKTLSLPNTGMAVTIDIGDPYQLHPPDKADVGHRLALEARHLAYGEDIVYSGPLYDTMLVEGNKIRLTFKNRGSGLTIGTSPYVPAGAAPVTPTKLTGFGIAGEDQKFVWADAVIDGDTIVVSSPDVSTPVAVRYDWNESPTGDLYNKEGLPASPFRTDSWDVKK
jgi:sialate O-acetylesterase